MPLLWITWFEAKSGMPHTKRHMDAGALAKMWWAWVLVALIAGLGAGYWYGNRAGIALGVAQEKAAETARREEAEKKAAQAANPFEQATTNPFEKNPVNPFEGVKVNPFE